MAIVQAFAVVVLIALGAPAWLVVCSATLPAVSALRAVWDRPLGEVLRRPGRPER